MSSSIEAERRTVQLEAALVAADRFAVITAEEHKRIRVAFETLSEKDQRALFDGRLKTPLADMDPHRHEQLVALLVGIQARLHREGAGHN